MKTNPRRTIVRVKLFVVACVALLAVVGLTSFSARVNRVSASSSGPAPTHTGAPNEANCTACHTSFPVNSGTGGVSISGIPANYLPNQAVPVTVTVSQASAVIFGFQLTAIDSRGRQVGTYTLPAQTPAQIQLRNGFVANNQRQYVEHTSNGLTPTQFDTKSWTFTWKAPAQRVGKVSFYAAGNAANSDGSTAGDYIYTTAKSSLTGTAISNFDGDDKSDVAVFRPASGEWFSLKSTNGAFQSFQFGASGDKPVAGDFDGDGKSDYAVFRPSNGVWYLQQSRDGFKAVQFGHSSDVPTVGDYDGDGRTDFAVWRPSNGVWYILKSSGGIVGIQFGIETDKPAQGDFDADGKTDVAVFRKSTGTWFIQKSTEGFASIQFGASEDKPVAADFDGDGKTDVAVFRPSNGVWYFQKSTDGFGAIQFGAAEDKPAPADFDGDGRADVAVYRPSVGIWYIYKSTDASYYGVGFGGGSDVPVPAGGFIAE